MVEYEVKFEICPCCGEDNFRQTCIGYVDGPNAKKPPARDPNKRTCMECGAQWYAAEVVTPSQTRSPEPAGGNAVVDAGGDEG